VGKYGTNLEGFGAFEGGVNADKGAPLVSTSSDGETALLFGPAALREIQAGVANGDFAIPPDAAGDTITEENPLPYWTFTDVNSAGAITAAIVADAGAGSGNVLRFTVASGTLTGKSATLTRFVPVASSASRSFSFYAEATFDNGTSSAQSEVQMTGDFYTADQTTTTGSQISSDNYAFNAFSLGPTGITAPDLYAVAPDLTTMTAPADAAYLKLTITISTVATQSADRTVDLTEVRLNHGLPELLITDRDDPTTAPAFINAAAGELNIQSGSGDYVLIRPDTIITAATSISLNATDIVLNGENSNWIARISATAAQSLANNLLVKITFNTASSTPDIGSYDPKGWFDNANDNITIGQAGFYAITANVAFAANTTGRREVNIVVNGTIRASTNLSAAPASTTNLSVSTNLYLTVGDLVTVSVVQTSGGALNSVNSPTAGVFPALSVGRIGA
jgi:hypothetical protein